MATVSWSERNTPPTGIKLCPSPSPGYSVFVVENSWGVSHNDYSSHSRIMRGSFSNIYHEKFVRFFLVKPTEVWKFPGDSPFQSTCIPVDSSTHQSSCVSKLSFKCSYQFEKTNLTHILMGDCLSRFLGGSIPCSL